MGKSIAYYRQMEYLQIPCAKTGHDTLKEQIENLWNGEVKSMRTVLRNKSWRVKSRAELCRV